MAKYLVIIVEGSGTKIDTWIEDNISSNIEEVFSEIYNRFLEGEAESMASNYFEIDRKNFRNWYDAFEFAVEELNSKWPNNTRYTLYIDDDKTAVSNFDGDSECGFIVLNDRNIYWDRMDDIKNIIKNLPPRRKEQISQHMLSMLINDFNNYD